MEDDMELDDFSGMAPSTSAAAAGGESFPKGTIKKVRLHNFMTYGECVVVNPGAKLNLVLGPNGTGKSSLVCGLCVGLGGSPKLLGRADNLRDFVKRGKTSAWTEITLSGGPGRRDHVIRRDIQLVTGDGGKKTYSSEWRLDGQPKPQKDILALVQSLNIQFDNLCQFLPQDKVVEFARLDPQELLAATQKTIGDASLYDKHKELIELRDKAHADTMSRDAKARDLAKKVAENEKLERDYDRFRRRQELLQEVEVLKAKLAWRDVESKQGVYRESKNMLLKGVELLKRLEDEVAKEEHPASKLQDAAAAAKVEALKRQEAVKQSNRSVDTLQNRYNTQISDVENLAEERGGLKAQSETRRLKIAAIRATLEAAKKRMTQLPVPPPDLPKRMQALEADMNDKQAQIEGLSYDIEQLQQDEKAERNKLSKIEGDLRKQSDTRMQRLRLLRDQGVQKVYEYVEANRTQFRSEVYGPVVMHIDVTKRELAGVMEQQCARSLSIFVVNNKHDDEMLSNFVRQNRLRVTVYSYIENVNEPVRYPAGHAANYEQFGIMHTLDQVLEAPPLVKAMLIEDANLNTTYVGNQTTDDRFEELTRSGQLKWGTLYTPTHQYKLTTSKYNSACMSTSANELGPARYLNTGTTKTQEVERLERLRDEVAEKLKEVRSDIDALRSQKEGLSKERAAVSEQLMKLTGEHNKHRSQRGKLDAQIKLKQVDLDHEQQQPDPLTREPALTEKLAASADAFLEVVASLQAALQRQLELSREAAVAEARYKEFDMQAKAASRASDELRTKLASARNSVKKLEGQVKRDQKAFQERRDAATANHPLSDALKAKFEDLPNNPAELTDMLDKKEAEANQIGINNPRVAQEYLERKQQISVLQAQVDTATVALDELNESIATLRAAWLPELQRIVEKINSSFSSNFSDIGCAGEVLLAEHEDYSKFAIQIMVKFREEEPLQLLTANRQSGGERSVSTILYLVALQNVTVTPFRVVDEINQGMDPVNERKVFKLLVDAACKPGTPQCFLLTPKLLPDLPFTSDITVLNIFNGPHIDGDVSRAFKLENLYGSNRALAEA